MDMILSHAKARIHVALLIVVLLIATAAGVGLVAARHLHRDAASEAARKAGQAAYEAQDWPEAVRSWKTYLRYRPEDVGVLRDYGKSLLRIRPPTSATIGGAMSVYSQLIKLAPDENTAYETLAMLSAATGQFDSLARVARARLQYAPDDPNAPVWLAQALIGQERKEQARQTLEGLTRKLQTQPGTYRQYVQACLLMSDLADNSGTPAPAEPTTEPEAGRDTHDPKRPRTPLEWLDRAVSYDPNSCEALLARARLCRQMADNAALQEGEKQALRDRARQDLTSTEALKLASPRLRYALSGEWLFHGDLDRAEAHLKAIDDLSPEVMGKHFLDPNEWKTMRFLLIAELASKRDNCAEAPDLIRTTLASLTEPSRRLQILPAAIDLYLKAGRPEEANDCVAKYAAALASREQTRESVWRLTLYQARVALARGKPYDVIDILQEVVQRERSNPQIWQLCDLLAAAYQQTRQSSRAADTWTLCLELLQRHPRPTEAMVRRTAEIRGELPACYARLGDWQKVLESTGGSTPAAPNDSEARLLRIEATVHRMADQGESLSAAQFAALDQELNTLRQQDPNNARIRVFQAVLWEGQGQTDRAEAELKQTINECERPLAAAMQLTGLYRRTGRRVEALAVCRQALENNPTVAQLWSTLANLQENALNREAARRCLEEGLQRVIDKRGRDFLSLRLAGLDLRRPETRSAGIARLTELVAQDPQDTQARNLLLTLKEIQDDPCTSARLITELRQIEGPSGLTWRFHQASVWFSSRDWPSKQQEITALLQHCIEADPRSTPPVLLLGRLYERLGDLRSAEGVYRQALATGPSAPEVAERLAHLLIRQGRPAEAIEILPSISPVRRSYVLEQAGDQSRAIEYLQGRIERDLARTDAEARVQLARLLYERTKDAQRALFHLDEAMAIDPNSHTQAATRALILSGQGRGVDALQVLNDYVAKHDTFRAYWMRGAYLAEQGELERAEEDYRKLATRADSGAAGCELLAGFYAEHGKLDQAIQTADEGTRAYPDNLRLKYRQMQLLLQRGQPPDGEKAREIRTVLQRELPNSAELMQYEALEKLANPTPEALAEARQILERVVQLNPLAVNAHLVLIDVLIRQRELQAASAQAVRALAANPKSRPLQVARAKVELTLGYGRAAFQLADQVLADDPNNAAALLTAVNGALASKDRRLWEQARTQIEAAAGRIPDKERLLARARVYLALGQPERAIPELDAYCRTEPGSTSLPALVTLADLYRSAGDLDRADKTVARAQALAPDSQIVIHARFLLRLAQNRLADLAGISAAYISAREQDPTIVVSAASRLMSLPTKDHRQQALQLFEHGVTRWPRSLETRLGLGLALYTAGEAERARQIYETLLQEFPSNPQVLNDLAWILQEHKQDYAKALELADQGVRLTLGNPDLLEKYMFLLDTRGTILMKMSNRWNEARQDLEKLVRLAPADSPRMARTLLKLGQVCLQLKDPRQAKEHLTRALEIDGRLGVFTAEERAHISQMLQERSGAE